MIYFIFAIGLYYMGYKYVNAVIIATQKDLMGRLSNSK